MGIRDFNLRRSQVRKRGKGWFVSFFPCIFIMQMIVLKIFVFPPPFQLGSQKFFLSLKYYWRGFFSLAFPNSRLWDKQMLVNKGV